MEKGGGNRRREGEGWGAGEEESWGGGGLDKKAETKINPNKIDVDELMTNLKQLLLLFTPR